MAKEMQTLKLNPELLKDLKRTAKKKKVAFNSYCESVLLMHHFIDDGKIKQFNEMTVDRFRDIARGN